MQALITISVLKDGLEALVDLDLVLRGLGANESRVAVQASKARIVRHGDSSPGAVAVRRERRDETKWGERKMHFCEFWLRAPRWAGQLGPSCEVETTRGRSGFLSAYD